MKRKSKRQRERQRAQDGIHYEILKRHLTEAEWTALEVMVEGFGVQESFTQVLAQAKNRWTRAMKKHLRGALREINRKLSENKEYNALL